jgi:hypothetical protein
MLSGRDGGTNGFLCLATTDDNYNVSNIRRNLVNNIAYLTDPSIPMLCSVSQYQNTLVKPSVTGGHNLLFQGTVSGLAGTAMSSNIVGATPGGSADPQFTNPGVGDFSIQPTSPAKYSGIAMPVTTDYVGLSRPQGTNGVSLGAYEVPAVGGSGTLAPSSCDLNADGIVNNADIQVAINQSLGLSRCTNADLVGSGQCNVVDVVRVIAAALGSGCKVGQ